MKQILRTIVLALGAVIAMATPASAQGSGHAAADGVGINLPLIGRLAGAGNTLYVTSVDVSNNTPFAAQADFYFDATNLTTQQQISIDGSISTSGLVAQGAATLRGHASVHFPDFVEALVQAGRITPEMRDQGLQGSLLIVFNGFNRKGQGAASARFWNALGEGTVGVSLTGREITSDEPRQLVATVRDTRGRSGPQLYTNLFINNIGLTPAAASTDEPVTVELTARRNSDGQPVGSPVMLSDIATGQTRTVSNLLALMQVPPGSEDTILVFVRVTSGNAAIAGITSTVDEVTRDGSVVEMSRADF